MKIRNNPHFRILVFVAIFLLICMAICVSNIVKLNIIALSLSMLLVISLCVILGYIYCNFERYNIDNKITEVEANKIEEPAEETETNKELDEL